MARPELDREDSLVRIYSRVSLLPHGYGDRILEFKGRRYHQFVSAGFARLPGKNMIVFVTDRDFEGTPVPQAIGRNAAGKGGSR